MQPPHNPYSNFPNPNEPTRPVDFVRSGQPSGMPPRKPELSFDAIQQAWKTIWPYIGSYLGASTIVLVILMVMKVLQMPETTYSYRGRPQLTGTGYTIGAVGTFLALLTTCGMMRMAINHLRTGRPNFTDVFSVVDEFPNIFIAGILVHAAIYIGFCCCCFLPGFLLNGLYIFVFPLIVDHKGGVLTAMRNSYAALVPQLWMAMLFALVIDIIVVLGLSAFLVGFLFTLPLGVMAVAINYRIFFDNNSGFNTGTGPVAPIANPRF